jgi:hypothetical protein
MEKQAAKFAEVKNRKNKMQLKFEFLTRSVLKQPNVFIT